jgi:hypothetical protein
LPTCAPIARNTASKRPAFLLREHVVDAVIGDDRHAHRLDARDLLHQSVAREPVLRDPVMHHSAGLGSGIADDDVVAHPPQVIGARQPAGTCANDQHALARRRHDRHPPTFFVGKVA